MVRVEDEDFARFLIEDYEWTWRGVDQATARSFEGIDFHILGGRRNESQFSLLLDRIDGARRRIFVQSPYITAPVSEALRRASDRGVEVVVLAPSVNNFGLCHDHIRCQYCGLLKLDGTPHPTVYSHEWWNMQGVQTQEDIKDNLSKAS